MIFLSYICSIVGYTVIIIVIQGGGGNYAMLQGDFALEPSENFNLILPELNLLN